LIFHLNKSIHVYPRNALLLSFCSSIQESCVAFLKFISNDSPLAVLLNSNVSSYFQDLNILLSRGVTTDWVWIGIWVYWTLTLLTTNNYNTLTELRALEITETKTNITLLDSGLKWRTFPFLWVPEMSSASATSFSLLTTVTLNCRK
jgi:hypothetical protein